MLFASLAETRFAIWPAFNLTPAANRTRFRKSVNTPVRVAAIAVMARRVLRVVLEA
jgi:hypothetical protein